MESIDGLVVVVAQQRERFKRSRHRFPRLIAKQDVAGELRSAG